MTDDDARVDLLPCPHCGHSATFTDPVWSDSWGQWDERIWCSSSHCRAQVRIIQTVPEAREKLVRMWNRRRAGLDGKKV